MTTLLTSPRYAALIGFMLALPYMALISLLILGIEPNLGPLNALLKDADPNRPDPGNFVVLGALLLSIVAFVVVRTPIVRTMRAGGSLFAHPANLLVAGLIVAYVAALVIAFAIDQYPCWIGVPNCD